MTFEQPEPGVLTSTYTFKREHQGYKGIVHGGMIAMVLDEMMINVGWIEGFQIVTGELTVRLKKPASVGESIRFEGRLENREGRVLRGRAEARNAAGEILAEATASCVRVRPPADNS